MQSGEQPKSPLRLDLVPNDLLTPEELVTLTGYEKPFEQKKILRQNHIHFFEVRNGEIRTTWYFVNNPTDLMERFGVLNNRLRMHQTLHPKTDCIPEPNETSLEKQLDTYIYKD